jgi:hypothetical protein
LYLNKAVWFCAFFFKAKGSKLKHLTSRLFLAQSHQLNMTINRAAEHCRCFLNIEKLVCPLLGAGGRWLPAIPASGPFGKDSSHRIPAEVGRRVL